MSRPDNAVNRARRGGRSCAIVNGGQRISALVCGALPPAEAEEIRAHCAVCADCGRTLEQYSAVWRRLDALESIPEASELIWDRLRDSLPAPIARHSRASRISFAFGAGIAVVAGLVIGLYAGSVNRAREDPGDSIWSRSGSLLAEGSDFSLGDIYLDGGPAEAETP